MEDNKKSQVSVEFVLIFIILMFSIAVFMFLLNQRIAQAQDDKDYLVMQAVANNIKEEVILATQVHNNYIRRFNIPYKINNKDYDIRLNGNELDIDILENGEAVKNYFAVLPIDVKGGFVEEKEVNTLDHCLTKNTYDGIRISRNQISLNLVGDYHKNEEGKFEIKKGAVFNVIVRINCVKNIRSLQFTINYDDEFIDLMGEAVVPLSSNIHDNAFFGDVVFSTDFGNCAVELGSQVAPGICYTNTESGRYTRTAIGENCEFGVGDIARLTFKAEEKGEAKIEFDALFDENFGGSIQILDCLTNERTTEGLPNTKLGLDLLIIE